MRGYMLLAGLAILGVSYVNASIESTFRKAGESIFDTGRKNALDFQEVAGLPTKPEEVTFALYTSDFRDMYTNVTHDNYKRLTNKEGRIYFLVHGWLEDRHATWYNDLKEGLLNKEPNAFVVEVDWHEPARQAYSFSSYNTEDVGNLIGTLIHNVHSKYDVPLKNFVVIGHSLGGQVAGWVGKKVQSLTQGKKLSRIIALDPAGPLFNLRVETRRLNHNDAKVVHVIHTDGNKFGFTLACGTIDFFPNGGLAQPGCLNVNFRANLVTTIWDPSHVSHGRLSIQHKPTNLLHHHDSDERSQINFQDLVQSVSLAEEVTGESLESNDVTFYLFNNDEYKNDYKVVSKNLLKSAINKEGRTYFLIHGWIENRKAEWYSELKDALLRKDPKASVIQVDWSRPASQLYSFSAYSTEEVGKVIAEFIIQLHKEHEVPIEKFVIIGHSLGGQTAGWVGKKFKKETNNTLERIIGLDPAGPLFNYRPKEKRLNSGDAKFVHVIHTNGNIYGFKKPCGTIDFFPNGGLFQPGCQTIDLLHPDIFCSHHRSYKFLIEGINNPLAFKAKECANFEEFVLNSCSDNVAHMADLWTTNAGKFYLHTSAISPFSKKLDFAVRLG